MSSSVRDTNEASLKKKLKWYVCSRTIILFSTCKKNLKLQQRNLKDKLETKFKDY